MTQFSKTDMPSTFTFVKTKGNNLYFTLARGGYIINISPMAMGIFVEPLLKLFRKPEEAGRK